MSRSQKKPTGKNCCNKKRPDSVTFSIFFPCCLERSRINTGNTKINFQEEMRRVCDDILKVKPDLVITEKGVSVGLTQRSIRRATQPFIPDESPYFIKSYPKFISKMNSNTLSQGIQSLQLRCIAIFCPKLFKVYN